MPFTDPGLQLETVQAPKAGWLGVQIPETHSAGDGWGWGGTAMPLPWEGTEVPGGSTGRQLAKV